MILFGEIVAYCLFALWFAGVIKLLNEICDVITSR